MELTKKEIVFPHVPHGGVIGGKMYDASGKRIFKDMGRLRWRELWEIHCNQWTRIVDEYEASPFSFHNAWHYLDHHPAFWLFRHGPTDARPQPLERRLHLEHLIEDGGIYRCVEIDVELVNTKTHRADDGPPYITEIWIELGKQSWPQEVVTRDPNTYDSVYHDYRLDCGGSSVEAAIIRAAYNVWTAYGNDRRVCDGPYDESIYDRIATDEEFEQAMREIGDDGAVNASAVERAQRLHGHLADAVRDWEEEAKQVKQKLKELSGYDPSPEGEAQLDAELDERMDIARES